MSFLRARPYVDMVLDVNMLARDRGYADRTVATLRRLLPAAPDFHDATESDLQQFDLPPTFEKIVHGVVELIERAGRSLSDSAVLLPSGEQPAVWHEAVNHLMTGCLHALRQAK